VRGIDYLPEKGLYITGELLFHHIAPHISSSKVWIDRFLGRGFMHSANVQDISVAQLEQRMLPKKHYGGDLSSRDELERDRCALCMIGVSFLQNCSDQEQMQSDWSVGSWDESLRLWYRVGHPNNTPRGSTAFDDVTEGIDTKVSAF